MSDELNLELFVRVAHMRILWLATMTTLLDRRLIGTEDITLLADHCRDAASLARGGTRMHTKVAQRCEADIADLADRLAACARRQPCLGRSPWRSGMVSRLAPRPRGYRGVRFDGPGARHQPVSDDGQHLERLGVERPHAGDHTVAQGRVAVRAALDLSQNAAHRYAQRGADPHEGSQIRLVLVEYVTGVSGLPEPRPSGDLGV